MLAVKVRSQCTQGDCSHNVLPPVEVRTAKHRRYGPPMPLTHMHTAIGARMSLAGAFHTRRGGHTVRRRNAVEVVVEWMPRWGGVAAAEGRVARVGHRSTIY